VTVTPRCYAYGGTRAVGARKTRAAVAMVTARSRPAVVPISQISRVFLGSVRCGAFRGGNVSNTNGVVFARRTVVMTKHPDSRNTG